MELNGILLVVLFFVWIMIGMVGMVAACMHVSENDEELPKSDL